MVVDLIYWLAFAWAVMGALCLHRAALALTASAITAFVMQYGGFDLFMWLLLDFAVLGAILNKGITRSELVIAALFLPAWGFYFLPEWRDTGTAIVVAIQFLISFPFKDAARRVKHLNNSPAPWDDVLPKVRANAAELV